MDTYRKKVALAAHRRNGDPLYNGSVDHATVLVEALFEHATEEVCILSGKLNALVFGNSQVVEKARLFLSTPDHRVRVLVERPQDIDMTDHPFMVNFVGKNDVEFRAVPERLRTPYHFMVMDRDSYRFEEDKNSPTAIAAFGDHAGGENLTHVFDSMWVRSEPLPGVSATPTLVAETA